MRVPFVLHTPPSLEEVHSSLFSIGPVKASGVDEFHAQFFQNYWETMWQDILAFVKKCFSDKSFPVNVNDTSICLIPKSENPQNIKHFWPISLCNMSYKIVSKVLVNRILPKLNGIISPTQNSFLPGRGCYTNYIAASEILHSMKQKREKRDDLL